MTRRELLQGLLAAGVWTAFKDFAFASQATTMKDIQDMQKNWKALLADGVKVPLASELLKLSKDEWRKRLNAELFDILCEIWNTPRISFIDLLTVPSYT